MAWRSAFIQSKFSILYCICDHWSLIYPVLRYVDCIEHCSNAALNIHNGNGVNGIIAESMNLPIEKS
jgi:hypothetical protein